MAHNQRGLLRTWENYRKIGLGLAVVLTVFFYVVVNVPLGICIFGLLLGAAQIWKPIGAMGDPTLGMYIAGTFAYRVASFFTVIKMHLASLVQPHVALSFGPPGEDADHGLTTSWMPPTRLSSYWSLAGALLLSLLEFPLYVAHKTVWFGGAVLPSIVAFALSTVGFFMAGQVAAAALRLRGTDPSELLSTEPRPAVMLHRVKAELDFRKAITRALVWGGAPAVVLGFIWAAAGQLTYVALLIPVAFIVAAAVSLSRDVTQAYLTRWEEREGRRDFWTGVFSFMRPDKMPSFVNEQGLPTIEEWESSIPAGSSIEDVEPYRELIKVATFLYPPGAIFADYSGIEERLRGALSANLVAIAPIGEFSEDGRELPGTVGAQGFRLWYTEETPGSITDPNMNIWVRELLARATIIAPLAGMKEIGYCGLLSIAPATRAQSGTHLVEVRIMPPPGVTLDKFVPLTNKMTSVFGVKWVRVGSARAIGRAADGTQQIIKMYLGDIPDYNNIKFVNPQSIVRREIDRMDWGYYFDLLGIKGPTGTPVYKDRRPTTPNVDKLVFELPDGVAFDRITDSLNTLKTTAGYDFIEAQREASTETKEGDRETANSAKFTIVAARRDPLARVFPFTEYKNQILTGREFGKVKDDWSPGVMADDTLARYEVGAEEPHLLIAGSSGSGKSVVANSMILQLAYNNAPTEMRFWMIEPKNELQSFQHLDNTERFLDSWTPGNFMKNAADLMQDAVDEMNRRYQLMAQHPKKPKKLEKAREIALRESERDGTDPAQHPLFMPFIYFFMEEVGTLFGECAAEDKEEQKRLLGLTAKIAQKSRASGIYLVALTQYPTNASIPMVIRAQMRRIGLTCKNTMASMVVIDEPGLEEIRVKGVGKIIVGGAYRSFRGFWVTDGDPDLGESNDVLDTTALIPTNSSAPAQAGSGKPSGPQTITVPDPTQSVFNLWSRTSGGMRIEAAVNEGRATTSILDQAVSRRERKKKVS